MKQKIIFGGFFLVLISVTTICGAQDLVLHLSFDELTGDVVKDLSEFGNDATFNKGNPKLIDGVFGKAMEFDGKTAGEIADSPSLDIVDAITIEFWALVKGGEAIQSGVEKGAAWVAGLYNLAALYNGGTILQFFDLPEPCTTTTIRVQAFRTVNGTFSPGHGTVMTLNSTLMANSQQRCRVRVNYHQTMHPFILVPAAQVNGSLPVPLMRLKSITTP